MLSTAYGFQNLLKEGFRHYAGLEEAVLRNVDACREVSALTRTSFGPQALKKMVVNHIGKIFVTSDCAAMLKEVEVQHPAARMLVLASRMQEEDFGDATNYVITLAGELLALAEHLLKSGLHPSAVIAGFEAGLAEALRLLSVAAPLSLGDESPAELKVAIVAAALAPKLSADVNLFAKAVARGCEIAVRPTDPRFDIDDFRTVKVTGGSSDDSEVIKGFVIARAPETSSTRVERAVVAVFGCPLDPQGGETKGTVLFTDAQQLLGYARTEEALAERIVRDVVSTGANVVVVGGSIAELCHHFLQKLDVLVLKVSSKFELQRLARCVNATILSKLGAPSKEELGYADLVEVRELGSTRVTVVEKDAQHSHLASLVLRGGTPALMDELERAVRKGVAVFKAALADGRFVHGGGATEAHLARSIERYAATLSGLEQYACAKFAQALEVFPRTLLENAGLGADTLDALLSDNAEAPLKGVDVVQGRVQESAALGVWDHLATKINALKLATHAATTVLRIDQIIIAKPSGGPKLGPKSDWDAED